MVDLATLIGLIGAFAIIAMAMILSGVAIISGFLLIKAWGRMKDTVLWNLDYERKNLIRWYF